MENLSTEFDGKELLQQTIYIIGLNPPANAGDLGSAPGWGAPLEEDMAAHSSALAWRIPRQRAGGSQRVGLD